MEVAPNANKALRMRNDKIEANFNQKIQKLFVSGSGWDTNIEQEKTDLKEKLERVATYCKIELQQQLHQSNRQIIQKTIKDCLYTEFESLGVGVKSRLKSKIENAFYS